MSQKALLTAVVGMLALSLSCAGILKLIDEGIITFEYPEFPLTNETINVTMIIDYGDGRIDSYNISLDPKNATVYHALLEARERYGLSFKAKYFPQYKSHYIYSINSTEENPKANKFWQYYINGNYAPLGVDLQKIKNGDVIEWKLQEPKIEVLEGENG